MRRTLLKSKIHRARVTDANVDYEGSITIDRDLMDLADILEYEQVHVWDVSNGARLTTYAIEGPRGSGTIAMNGAAARLVARGDVVIIGSYAEYDESEVSNHKVKKVFVNEKNKSGT